MISAAKLLLLLLLLGGCRPEAILLQGSSMGTTWTVRAVTDTDSAQLKNSVQDELDRVENLFSNWIPESAVSRFNNHHSTKPFPVNRDFFVVMNVALQIARETGGAYDPGMADIIRIWGFEKDTRLNPPSKNEITAALRHTGFEKVNVIQNGQDYFLVKKDTKLKLNLSGSAKGYAVDAVYLLLKTKGIDNFLVEAGGEVRTSGKNNDRDWVIGIEKPDTEKRSVHKKIRLNDMAIATSGNYRNFLESGGKSYSHLIDPKTGKPSENGILSVTIISPNCTYADTLATAVYIMGEEAGLRYIENKQMTEALIIFLKNGEVQEKRTSGFNDYILP